MRLSKNFDLEELTTTTHTGLKIRNFTESKQFLRALQAVAKDLLQPIRDHFGPIQVTSGFRGKSLNELVGGSATSQHCVGEAADFIVNGLGHEAGQLEVMKWIVRDSGIVYRQLLIERGCLHISLPHMDGRDGEVARYDVPTKTKVPLDLR